MTSIDPYSYCPGGTGKKIKFCCSDLVGELGKIQDMLSGGQRAACLEHIEALEKKHADRACLVTTKALLQSALGAQDQAAATLDGFLAKQPNNPVALAESSLVEAVRHGPLAGIQPLQKALELSEDSLSGRVVASVARLGEMLLMQGQITAARGHFMLAYSLNPQDEASLQLLARFFASPSVPLLLKNEQMLASAPDGVAWKAEFDAAVDEGRRGRWWRAADRLKALAAQAGDTPALWRNLATLRSWLGDAPGTVAALRKLAALDVPFDDAVEAEALAQLLDPKGDEDVVDEVRVDFDVRDFDRVTETLASDRRAAAFAWESAGIDFGDQPPPRAAFYLLDRPLPSTGVDIRLPDVPKILARLLLFGRQTDREARIEAYLRGTDLAAFRAAIAALAGDAIAARGEPEKVDDIPAAEAALSWSWRLPDDTPQEHVRALIGEQRRASVLERWTAQPSSRFDGRTPADAAADPKLRIAVAAQVLLIELSFSQNVTMTLFAELRSKLGLPQPATADSKTPGMLGVAYSRLHRLDPQALNDEELANYFQRALQVGARLAVRTLGQAVVARPGLKGKIDLATVYGHLSDLEENGDEAIRYLDSARKAAEEQNQSTAPWDLEELELRLRRGEPREFARLMDHIQQHHVREPGVARALMEILYAAGIVGPDGRPTGAAAAMPAAAEPAETGKLWTPDSGPAPAGGTTGKSGLWVPGD